MFNREVLEAGRSARIQTTMAGGVGSTLLQALDMEVAEHIIPSVTAECEALADGAESKYVDNVAAGANIDDSRKHGKVVVEAAAKGFLSSTAKISFPWMLKAASKIKLT